MPDGICRLPPDFPIASRRFLIYFQPSRNLPFSGSLMIVVLKPNLPLAEVEKVIAELANLGYEPRPIHGKVQTVIAAIGA
jgi:hypothetical protein